MFVGKTTKPGGAEEREQEASWQALGTMETGGVRSFADRNSKNDIPSRYLSTVYATLYMVSSGTLARYEY